MMAVAVAAAITPPAFARNLRRPVVTLSPSSRHQLMVGALGNVVPRPHERLELREGGVHLPGHGSFLRLFPKDVGRQLLEISEHRHWELDDLYLALELCPEPLQRDRVLHVEVREAIDLRGGGGMVEYPP